jgi:hypothetical protein
MSDVISNIEKCSEANLNRIRRWRLVRGRGSGFIHM